MRSFLHQLKNKINFNVNLSAFWDMPSTFYAVARGHKLGIYNTWNECKAQVYKYPNARYKKFATYNEATEFIKQYSGTEITSNKSKLSTLASSSSSSSLPQLYALGKRKNTLTLADTDSNLFLPPSKKRTTSSSKNENQNDFIIDADGYTAVYTDGACQKNGMKDAKAGIGVWFGDDHPLNISKPLDDIATNNKAEIHAVIAAVEQAKKAGIKKLKIHTDSKFLISCITTWMPKWKANGWRTTTGMVKNKTELIALENSLSNIEIAWNHVSGHVGIHGNEMADQLARKGCVSYKAVYRK